MKYGKLALSNADLLARWQAKGLIVSDPLEAQQTLDFIGYFRLRGYALPLMTTTQAGRVFNAGVTFKDILIRYELDRGLRRITLVAKALRLAVPLLESWLHALSILRNTCAHHGRVWNRKFGYRPEIDQRIKQHFANQQTYYCLAVIMRLFSRAVDTQDEWPIRLLELFSSHPGICSSDLGFPHNWEIDPVWN